MPGCAAIGCNNRSEKGYTMKCFPRDPTLRSIWKQRVGRADWEPSNNSFLCHVHFDDSQWVTISNGKVKLKKGAIPSIFTVTSTRKSPKKRQKMGAQDYEDAIEDLEEYEIEYLDDDAPLILSLTNQKHIPNVINIQTQNAETIGGQILQNIRILSSDTLRSLQTENIIIVADENDREIDKTTSDSRTNIMLEERRGKENVLQLVPTTTTTTATTTTRGEKLTPAEVKIEVKEELPENVLNNQDYDEIERKLQEICHSGNETDSVNNLNTANSSLHKPNNSPFSGSESSFSLEDLENGLETDRVEECLEDDPENSIQQLADTSFNHRVAKKRKRQNKSESGGENVISSESREKEKNTRNTIDRQLNLLPQQQVDCTSQDGSLSKPKIAASFTTGNRNASSVLKNGLRRTPNILLKSSIESKKRLLQKQHQNEKKDIISINNVKSVKSKPIADVTRPAVITPVNTEHMSAKLSLQSEVIEKLSGQLIMYKDVERKVKHLDVELQRKNKEIERLEMTMEKMRETEKSTGLTEISESESQVRNRIDYLEDSVKKLTKSLALEAQNRRKLEYQVKNRDNQIKELNWKLDKASKFLDRAERNANNYRRKMMSLQSVLKRKKLISERTNPFDELVICHSDNQSFTDNALKVALEIEKTCGIEGYQKLLDSKFPLPSLKELSKKYPAEVEYYEVEIEKAPPLDLSNDEPINVNSAELVNKSDLDNMPVQENQALAVDQDNDLTDIDVKMEHVEYLEGESFSDTSETLVQTVQDIFDECSDNDDLNLHELKRHVMFEAYVVTQS